MISPTAQNHRTSPAKTREAGISVDYVAWVRRANGRWIVHQGLGRNAEAYLEQLARTDPDRLLHSCRNAYLLVRESQPMEDPKPWFYAGLFSLATESEKQEFLAGHWFVATAITPAGATAPSTPATETVSPATLEKLDRIRAALTRLPAA